MRRAETLDHAAAVRGRDRCDQPAAGAGVDPARDLFGVEAAGGAGGAARRRLLHPAGPDRHPRTRRALPRLATALGARGGRRGRRGGRGGGDSRRPGLARAGLAPSRGSARPRFLAYAVAGGVAAALVGSWLVLVLSAAVLVEIVRRQAAGHLATTGAPHPGLLLAAAGSGGLGALAWVAFKVGALSYGGGFVIVPLMQQDAVHHYHWLTSGEFLNAVALGQVTPGPVVQTVAVVGYAAAGLGGGLLAALVAFAPSFGFVLLGAERFDRLLVNRDVRSFLDGAGPCRDRSDRRLCRSARPRRPPDLAGIRARRRRRLVARSASRRRLHPRRRGRRRRRRRPPRRSCEPLARRRQPARRREWRGRWSRRPRSGSVDRFSARASSSEAR